MGLHDGHRQRMKERFARHGLDSFAEHEVLELLLYYAIPRRDTNELAHTLLDRFGSLERVLLAPREELMKVPGVGEGAALLLTLVPAVSQYTHRHAPQETILNSVDASGRYFMRLLRHERRELLYQACYEARYNRPPHRSHSFLPHEPLPAWRRSFLFQLHNQGKPSSSPGFFPAPVFPHIGSASKAAPNPVSFLPFRYAPFI